METKEIMSGFLDIKSEFLEHYPHAGPSHELKLWFAADGELLCVQDYKDKIRSIAVAFVFDLKRAKFKFALRPESRGRELISELCFENKFAELNQLAFALNKLFELCGTYPAFRK